MRKFDVSNFVFISTIVIATLITIIFNSTNSLVVLFSTICGVVATKMASNGKWQMFIFDILSNITYISICLSHKFYGEMILAYVIIFINFISLLEWRNNQQNGIVVVKKIKKVELVLSLTLGFVVMIGYAFAMKLMNSELPLLNSISTVLYILGSYFCFRRSTWQFYVWIGYELTYILIWLLSGNISGLILLVGGISELIYDIIGVVNWKSYSSFQQSKKSQILNFI